jgi:hypothetical protein
MAGCGWNRDGGGGPAKQRRRRKEGRGKEADRWGHGVSKRIEKEKGRLGVGCCGEWLVGR